MTAPGEYETFEVRPVTEGDFAGWLPPWEGCNAPARSLYDSVGHVIRGLREVTEAAA